ncbi:SixA phosphatase family protein [Prochlorothrix hollandica]|uniref:Phosphohistidine phosphatase n=1 Tax=Prochlorothrix hollandica PCC 9006 = CALU 1027 TaxID=317619 RepID=A0A0M2PUP6_PROHO|nr:histidine phosphatase family protein [Prochlorothrix hollandica]KKI98096.1 hypothetical protein PROH_20470 [Prochlorothrix hollandica PCC 9006 = CALU 1027]
MTKQLILFRHGKSDWGTEGLPDHDRPLAKRGIKAAQHMGKLVATADQIPDLVRSSTALRARTTAELAMTAGSWPCPLELNPALYDTTPLATLDFLRMTPDSINRLILVGHEPTWSTLASLLMGGGQVQMPTGAMISLELGLDSWATIAPDRGCLHWLLIPRLFAN